MTAAPSDGVPRDLGTTAVQVDPSNAIPGEPVPRRAIQRVRRHRIHSATDRTAARIVAGMLLTNDGEPDPMAVGHVLVHTSGPLAAWVTENLDLPEDLADEAIATAAALMWAGGDVQLSVAEAIALRCQEHGVKKAFAYPGTSELALCQAFAELGDGLLVNARGDAEAVFMAGGGGASETAPAAVAIVHGARGLTNAAGAVADLRRNEVPTVVIVGLPSTRSARYLPPHGEERLVETVGAFAKRHWQLDWAEGATAPPDPVRLVDEAVGAACALPRGPVLVGVPQDILEARGVPLDVLLPRPVPSPEPAPPTRRTLRRALTLINQSTAPVVLIDDYLLRHPGAHAALDAFASRLGAPVLQTRYRRGPMLFPQLSRKQVSRFAGGYDPDRTDHRDLMRKTDLVITVEDRNIYSRVVGPLPNCPKIAITSDGSKARKNGYLSDRDVVIEGSPVPLLAHLAEAAAAGPRRPDVPPPNPGDPDKLLVMTGPAAASGDLAPGLGFRRALAETVRGCLAVTGARHVVDDSQMVGGLLAQRYDHTFGDAMVLGDHGGFVGAGIPHATGLAITHRRPVVCLTGDQGFTNGAQGLVCAAQEGAPVLFLVFNNGESVSLRRQAGELRPDDPIGDFDRLLRNPPTYSYVPAAKAAGLVSGVADMSDGDVPPSDAASNAIKLVRALWSGDGPVLVELRLPSLGPAWEGVWLTRGYDERPGSAAETDPGSGTRGTWRGLLRRRMRGGRR